MEKDYGALREIPVSMPPAANRLPPEILLQIYFLLSPRDFNNARRTCSQWIRASFDVQLLENMLKRAGWFDSWMRVCQQQSSGKESRMENEQTVFCGVPSVWQEGQR
ncbi:hypothetical protein MAP00_001326 [Monascus purpureus]|nr:hypothetical protein MAP00_001326 [Monascus purpureus]